jgi:predicted ABC-type ATPase
MIGLYINADDIKAETGCSDLVATEEAEHLREYCLKNRTDFTFETVLSTDRNDIVNNSFSEFDHAFCSPRKV